jgi:cbb3-type cytochrome oxidase maturation protein
MTIVWILFVCSVILLPTTALLALRWAVRHGEFRDLRKTALSIFDEEEPVGQLSDRFPDRRGPSASHPAATPPPSPSLPT